MEQDVRIKLLNEHSHEDEDEEDEEGEASTDEPHTTRQKTSTESLIDKLDQVQSDLSSGLLTGKTPNFLKSLREQLNNANSLYYRWLGP